MGHTKVQERDYIYYVKDNCISGNKKEEIAGEKPANGDIT
jgi:hypothetical protein